MQQPPQPLPEYPFGEPTQPTGQPSQPPPDTFAQPPQPPPQPPPAETFAQPQQQPGAPSAQPQAQPPQGAAPGRATWVTFSRLRGHPLIDITKGKRIGVVHDLLFDPQRRTIQAFSTKGGLLHPSTLVPTAKATIGADAVTFQPGALAGQDTSWLHTLPRASDLIGRRVHSNTGQLLGTVAELRIDPGSNTLLALELAPEQTGAALRLGSARRLLAANSVISYGPDTIVAREEGLSEL